MKDNRRRAHKSSGSEVELVGGLVWGQVWGLVLGQGCGLVWGLVLGCEEQLGGAQGPVSGSLFSLDHLALR